jgi:hypothetical protein
MTGEKDVAIIGKNRVEKQWISANLYLVVARVAAIDFQIDLDRWGIKWEMIEFGDRNFDQFLQSISIISHLLGSKGLVWRELHNSSL